MITNTKIPIQRNNLFFSKGEFSFFEDMGKTYVEQILNTTVILYSIDYIFTTMDDLYQEINKISDIKYKTPVELHCRYNINQSQNNAYIKTNNSGRYKQTGNIEISLYDKTLKEMDCDIKFGDIIGVVIKEDTIVFFEVWDDGKRNFSNTETMFGYKPLWRKIKASELDDNIFEG